MGSEDKSYLLDFQEMNGGVVNKPDIAIRIAEIVIANIYGDEEVERQRPFLARDEKDRWLIEGSYNRDNAVEGHGPVSFWIRKRDAKIIDIIVPAVLKSSPEVRKIVEDTLKGGPIERDK